MTQQDHEAIHKMTIADALTGAYNKRHLLEFLEREIARCVRHGRPLAVLMFDVDHFKEINDRHNHLAGDRVLREIARRLLGRFRREDLLARYGGDEFTVVLPETDTAGARTVAEHIRRRVADQPFEYAGTAIPVTVSVGFAQVQGKDVTVTEAIRAADTFLYQAKHEGRNRIAG